MSLHMQNPGGQAGASRNHLGGWLLLSFIALDREAQTLISRFHGWMRWDWSWLCFGESCND